MTEAQCVLPAARAARARRRPLAWAGTSSRARGSGTFDATQGVPLSASKQQRILNTGDHRPEAGRPTPRWRQRALPAAKMAARDCARARGSPPPGRPGARRASSCAGYPASGSVVPAASRPAPCGSSGGGRSCCGCWGLPPAAWRVSAGRGRGRGRQAAASEMTGRGGGPLGRRSLTCAGSRGAPLGPFWRRPARPAPRGPSSQRVVPSGGPLV